MNRVASRPLPVLVAALLLSAMTAAKAEMDADTLIKEYDSGPPPVRAVLKSGVSATVNGMDWTNEMLRRDRHEEGLYCPPRQVALVGEQLIDIIRRYVSQYPFMGKIPFGLVLLQALRTTFPCPPQSK